MRRTLAGPGGTALLLQDAKRRPFGGLPLVERAVLAYLHESGPEQGLAAGEPVLVADMVADGTPAGVSDRKDGTHDRIADHGFESRSAALGYGGHHQVALFFLALGL